MLSALFASLALAAQVTFSSPVHYEVTLAGNFGEPRPNHFHGGIDVKTGQVEGKAMLSIGDGYVSQVTVGMYGFGNAVYVRHPQGYTSVYCHLKAFSPRVKAVLRRHQYLSRQSKGCFRFKPYEVPVAQGDIIAQSGNTGASQAPHLHLELLDNRTWAKHDALQYIPGLVKDTTPPQAHGFMATPMEGEGVFNGTASKQVFGFPSHHLSSRFTAWGKVGFAIWANDYSEATYNNYGVRLTQLFVDNQLVFQSDLSTIPAGTDLQVNYWGDYQHYLRSNVWYMRSWVLPGLTLPVFKTNALRGVVDFNEERVYHLKYVLSDIHGNVSTYEFSVEGKKTVIPRKRPVKPFNVVRWDRPSVFQVPGAQLSLGRGTLAEMVELRPQVKVRRGEFSYAYRFTHLSYPLLKRARVSLRLMRAVEDSSKLYVVSTWGTPRYMGGDYRNGWVTGSAFDLGATYELAYDDKAPSVGPVGQGAWTSSQRVTISVSDKESGLSSYEGYIDGRFVVFEEVPKSAWVRCDLREAPVRKTGKTHQLKFIATDNRRNQRVYTTTFVY